MRLKKCCDCSEHVHRFGRLMPLNVLYIVAIPSEPRCIFHLCSQKLFFKGGLTRMCVVSESQVIHIDLQFVCPPSKDSFYENRTEYLPCSNEAAIHSNTVQIVKNRCTMYMYTRVTRIGTLALTSMLALQYTLVSLTLTHLH